MSALDAVSLGAYHDLDVLTALEYETLALRFPDWPSTDRKISTRVVMLATRVSRTTVRDRIANGLRKIAAYEERAA